MPFQIASGRARALKLSSMARGKPEIDIERCKGCELCVGVCPQAIIVVSHDFNRKGSRYVVCEDESSCTACAYCALICPDAAIQVLKFSREEAEALEQ